MGSHRQISENDWKQLRKMTEHLIDAFCARILKKISVLIESGGDDTHQTYLKVYKLIQIQDKKLDELFNGMRRSTAFVTITALAENGLIDEAGLSRFSEETRAVVHFLLDSCRTENTA